MHVHAVDCQAKPSLLRPSERREEIRGCTRGEWDLDLLASCYPYLRLSAYLSIRACIDVCFISSAMSISNSEVIDRITERLTSRLKEELRSEVRKEELEASRKKVKEASKMEGCVKSQFTDHSAFALNPKTQDGRVRKMLSHLYPSACLTLS